MVPHLQVSNPHGRYRNIAYRVAERREFILSFSYSSALQGLQEEMRRCRHTCGSLGDSTAHLEGHGGREGGGEERPSDEEENTAAAGLGICDWSPRIHEGTYSQGRN